MQIAGKFDKESLKNIGLSLVKNVLAGVVIWLGLHINEIGSAIKDPTTAILVTLVLRSIVTVGDEWRKGQQET